MEIKPWQWRKKCAGSISLCMIMKDEERLLSRCLDSVRGLVDEIIIVDTGSTDRSIEIAKSYGAVVLEDPWQDDFARPRNIGIAHATKDWILILDPDEVISCKDHTRVRELTADFRFSAYQIDTWNYTNNPVMQGGRPCPGRYAEERGFKFYTPSTKTRLFRNGLGLKFKGRWHELVDYIVDEKKLRGLHADVVVHHFAGEFVQKSYQAKRDFYLRMGELKVADDPSNDQAWWELGVAEGISGHYARAVRSILLSCRKGFYTADRMFQLAHALNQVERKKESRYYFEKAVCRIFPNLTHCDERLKSFSSLDDHLRMK